MTADKMITANKVLPRDWVWISGYPVYQIIGTIRHEGAHALAVLWQGGRVTKFVFWPTWTGRFYWGYVSWAGRTNWFVSASPYLLDLFTFAIFYLICTRVKMRQHWLWVNLYLIGLVSPLINSAYRYVSSFFRPGDLTSVYQALPVAAVHAYFLLTIFLYLAGLARIQQPGHGKVG
jgi:hypothetical protein